MPKCVIITNLDNTSEVAAYLNDLSLSENLVSHIIMYTMFRGDRLHDKAYRDWVRSEFDVREIVSTVSGEKLAYSIVSPFHAKYEMRTHGVIFLEDGSKWDGLQVIEQTDK